MSRSDVAAPERRPVSIVLCADTSPTQPFGSLSPGVDAVFDVVRNADFALANVEIPLTVRGAPVHKLLNIRADPERAKDLAAAGIGLAALANNHAVDYGWEGLQDTVQALNTAGIRTVGVGANHGLARAPVFTQVNGLRIGTVAFSCLTPTGMGAGADRPGISALHVRTAYEIDPWYQMEEPGDPGVVKIRTRLGDEELAALRTDVQAARQQCDLLIASVHWGFGATHERAEYQTQLAHELVDAGADVVHGHHPHALQPIEFYRGRLVIYSANVFIGQQVLLPASEFVHKLWAQMSPLGFLTCIHWHHGGAFEVRLRPTRLDADRLPRFAQGQDLDQVAAVLSEISPGTCVGVEGDALVVRPKG